MNDTIVAVATPPGQGGIGIVRLSGPLVPEIIRTLCNIKKPKPRLAKLVTFSEKEGEAIDQGLLLFFPAPASFTGENVAELQAHGSPVVMQMLIRRCIQLGARLARPGEFSERAFLNDRIDLVQAEALADLISSHTEAAARSAVHSLQGEFSRLIEELVAELTSIRVEVEAAIDFPEEEIDFINEGRVQQRCHSLDNRFQQIMQVSRQGQLLRDGLKVVLTGPPNAGKSSLLNALSQVDRAIVSEHAGTTRDVLPQQIQLDGLPLEIIDTAGLRDSSDDVEAEGVRRALLAQSEADLILLVVDDSVTSAKKCDELKDQIDPQIPLWLVLNKIDLSGLDACYEDETVAISAMTGKGLELLRHKLKQFAGYHGSQECRFIARQRHIDALQQAHAYLADGINQLKSHYAIDLLAEDLRCAQQALGEITGEVHNDDLLGMIFSSFCIGK